MAHVSAHFIACILVLYFVGHKPVLCDVSKSDLNSEGPNLYRLEDLDESRDSENQMGAYHGNQMMEEPKLIDNPISRDPAYSDESANIQGVDHKYSKSPQSGGRWVVMTTRYKKKLQRMDFENFALDGNRMSEKYELEKGWKGKILKAINAGEEDVEGPKRKTTLKSANGNTLTLLSSSAAMNPGSMKTNVTCMFVEEYDCYTPVTSEVHRPCWPGSQYYCVRYEVNLVKAICRKNVEKCCTGYTLGSSGYCERPVIAQPRTSSTCGGFLTAQEGVITTPNYPEYYANDLKCKWRIQGPSGYRIVLKVIHLAIEEPVGACDLSQWECFNFCEFDDVTITDVIAGMKRTLCGYRAPTEHIISQGNSLEIEFSSDVSSGGPGFRITYALASEYQLSSFHPECIGGQTWQICHRRCAATCQQHRDNATEALCIDSARQFPRVPVSRLDELTCIPGCACPPSTPIWQNGKCIKPESCLNNLFKCGKSTASSLLKIVGGRIAHKKAWPWMAQLESDSFFHICGATLICSSWVVTAAHCFLNYEQDDLNLNTSRYYINVGKYWKYEQLDGRKVQIFRPDKIIVHPNYKLNVDSDIDVHDIALIRLSRAVDVTDYVRPACLPQRTIPGVTSEKSRYAKYQQPSNGTVCRVLGWGTTEGIGPKADQLKEASISIRPGKDCVYDSYDWKLMICAGGHKDEDTCKGDSGGPLLCRRGRNLWFLDGITSFGDSCGEEGVAGGYTRISSYVTWIREIVGQKCEK